MSTETQWRACAKDHRALVPDYSNWTNDEAEARQFVAAQSTYADPPYDDTWLEKRTVSEPERVE